MALVKMIGKDDPVKIRQMLGEDPDESYGMNDGKMITGMTLYGCVLNNCTLVNCKLYKCLLGACRLENCKQYECWTVGDDMDTILSGKSSAKWMTQIQSGSTNFLT
jgi:hypothetical protein